LAKNGQVLCSSADSGWGRCV